MRSFSSMHEQMARWVARHIVRRKQLVAQAKHAGEQTKVSIRNIRRDTNKQLEKEEKDKLITEDDMEKGRKQIDDITKECTDKVDEIIKHKSDEILLD